MVSNMLLVEVPEDDVENETLLAEDVLKKLSELREQPLEDLEVMEKAAELYQGNFFNGFDRVCGFVLCRDGPDGAGL